MSFRVLIAGSRSFTDYPLLRASLDALLANRLPDVVLLTAGGSGVPMLAASYGAANRLEMAALTPDFLRFPVGAAERRDAILVADADAAVVVWDGRDPAIARMLKLAERKGVPVHVIGGSAKNPTTKRSPILSRPPVADCRIEGGIAICGCP